MKKNKLFIILTIILAVLFFITAAVCNQCSVTPSEQTKIDVVDETDTDDTSSGTTEGETTTDTTSTTASGEIATPTIKLEIILGPEYSSADDVCYYRIKAIVAGSPEPVITFSKDDSFGAWGKYIAQINLHHGETYTLTAKAENDAGSVSASIDLEWSCTQGETQDSINTDLIDNITKPSFDITINQNPVLTKSFVDPSANLNVGQIFYVRMEGYDPDGDDVIFYIVYATTQFELLEQSTPTSYKLKTLKAGTFTINTGMKDENGSYSNKIPLTIVVSN